MPLQTTSDAVVVVNPLSNFVLHGGRGKSMSSSEVSEKAQALLPCLLDVFIKGYQSPLGRQPTDPPAFAPWTWATEDSELANALEQCLSQHGVVAELCRVSKCSKDDIKILDDVWSRVCQNITTLMGQGPQLAPSQLVVTPGDTTRCHGCGISGHKFSEPLRKCSACGQAWYHSKDCQQKHWKTHKPACLANRPTNTNANTITRNSASSNTVSNSEVDACKFYNTTARSSPEAQALMKALHLSFPSSPAAIEGMGQVSLRSYTIQGKKLTRNSKPLRSLIYVGKDTPENMKALFGPDWRASIGKNYDETRLDVLLDPPRGSPSYALHQWLSPDGRHERSPRPATDAEQQVIGKVRAMQDAVRRRIGAGKSPSTADMQAILSSYGSDWTSHLQTYMLAINTMDQGVRR